MLKVGLYFSKIGQLCCIVQFVATRDVELFGPIEETSVMVVIGPVQGPYVASLVDSINFQDFVSLSHYLHPIDAAVPYPAPEGWIWFRTAINAEVCWFMLRAF